MVKIGKREKEGSEGIVIREDIRQLSKMYALAGLRNLVNSKMSNK